MRPEYQTAIGGRKGTSSRATRTWPSTLAAKSANRTHKRRSALLVHPFVVPVPVALEKLLRVVFQLQLQELLHLGEAGVDLAAQSVAVIGREVAAAVFQADVDQAPEHV